MKILVSGGCGFIGSHIVDQYLADGHRVVVIDDLSTGVIENLNPKAKFYGLNINHAEIERVFQTEGFDIVNHHAAQINVRYSVEDPLFDARVNVLGSLNLLNLGARYRIKRFIFASSGGAVYGDPDKFPITEDFPVNPLSPYAVSKIAAETYLTAYSRLYDFDCVILRYSNVYGPRQISKAEAGVISIFIDQLLNNQECVVFGDGDQVRDYVYVRDVVAANVLALTCRSGLYNIGTGIGTSVNELIEILADITKNRIRHRHGPARRGEVFKNVLDCSRIRKLGWNPAMPLKQGINQTFQYFSQLNASTKKIS